MKEVLRLIAQDGGLVEITGKKLEILHCRIGIGHLDKLNYLEIIGEFKILDIFIGGRNKYMEKYLKFSLPLEHEKKNNFSKKIISKILKTILPVSNPDFEYKIDDVKHWLVEYDEENVPIREIGLDENDKVILKMPYKKNYGFWTDNELLYEDFINRFSAVKIDGIMFNAKWNTLN